MYLPYLLNFISTQEIRIDYLMGLSGLENLQIKRKNIELSASKDLAAFSTIPIHLFKNARKQDVACVVKKKRIFFFFVNLLQGTGKIFTV